MRILKNKILITVLFVPLLLAVAFILALFSYQKVYAGRIYQNVYFGDVNLSGLSPSAARLRIQRKLQADHSQDITLYANGKEVKVKLEDTGIEVDIDKIIEESYSIARSGDIVKDSILAFKTFYLKVDIGIQKNINQTKFQNFLDIAVAKLESEAKDAEIKIENGQIVVTSSVSGVVVKKDNIAKDIFQGVSNNVFELNLETETVNPSVTESNFSTLRLEIENQLKKDVILQYESQTFKPSRTEIGYWLEIKDSNGQHYLSFNKDNIKAYLNRIGKSFEIAKVDKKINSLNNEVIDEGKDGLYLDKDLAAKQIVDRMSTQSVFVELKTNVQARNEIKVIPVEGLVAGRYEGKYLDIDLTNQQLCKIEGQNVLDCFKVSSGKPSMPTPVGAFQITAKHPRLWGQRYGLYMPFWMQFMGDYGIHELPEWPGGYKEGENHLGTPVSHGCVRLGVGAAEAVYNWTDVGTPVYIHK